MDNQEKNQSSKIREILTKEYEYEDYLLCGLSIVAIVLGVLIFAGVLTVGEGMSLISEYPTLFAWIVTIVGVVGLILSIIKIRKKVNL